MVWMYVKSISHMTIQKIWNFPYSCPCLMKSFLVYRTKMQQFAQLWEKVANGLYSGLIKNDILYRSVIDNGHNFKAAVLPEKLTNTILFLGHNQSGHNVYQRTYTAIKHVYYWKGMRKHILVTAKVMLHVLNKKQIFEPGVQPVEFICIDLIGEFYPPSSKGNIYALTAVCMFTGYTFCIPIKNKSAEVITARRKHISFLFSVCRKLLSDKGTEF